MVAELIDDLDLLLVMTVNPGFGGQALIPATVDKVRRARRLLDERIEVNARRLREAVAPVGTI
jgi:ribulose-phosphate 3-epimerase